MKENPQCAIKAEKPERQLFWNPPKLIPVSFRGLPASQSPTGHPGFPEASVSASPHATPWAGPSCSGFLTLQETRAWQVPNIWGSLTPLLPLFFFEKGYKDRKKRVWDGLSGVQGQRHKNDHSLSSWRVVGSQAVRDRNNSGSAFIPFILWRLWGSMFEQRAVSWIPYHLGVMQE